MQIFAVIVAAGGGARFGGDKLRAPLTAHRVIDYALRPFAMNADAIAHTVLVVPPAAVGQFCPRVPENFAYTEVAGGASRTESVRLGLAGLTAAPEDRVLVHDAARPLLWASVLAELLSHVSEPDGAVLARPLTDALKREADGRAVESIRRNGLWRTQTPQLFPYGALCAALEGGEDSDDCASAMLAQGKTPLLVAGHPDNIKITEPADLAQAEKLLHHDPDDAYWTRL